MRKPTLENLKPWKKGDPSPNPKGRPISAKLIAEKIGEQITPLAIRNQLKKMGITTTEKKVIGVMMHVLAMKGLGFYQDADVAAIKEYLDRRDGKPEQPMKIDANIKNHEIDFDQLKEEFYANIEKRDSK